VGRDRAMAELYALLEESSRVAIVAASGMGGVGKTELAWQYAVKSRDDGHYAAGIWWMDARSVVVVTLLDKARRMGIVPNDQIVDEVERVQDCYGQWLNGVDGMALLVFDNVEDWEDVRRFFPRDARVQVLVTMREERSEKGVQPLRLGVLLPLDGFRLLWEVSEAIDRIGAGQLEAEALCEDLGYLPLAIELVGGLLKLEPDWSVGRVRGALAMELRSGALSPVNAAIELSWVRLSEAERQLLAMVATFGPGAVLWEWVEAVTGGSEVQVKPRGRIGRFLRRPPSAVQQWCFLLDGSVLVAARRRLVALNLLGRSGENLYGLHPLVRSFVRENMTMEIAPDDAIGRAFAQVMVAKASTIQQTVIVSERGWVALAVPHLLEVMAVWTRVLDGTDKIWCGEGLTRFYESLSLWNEAERCHESALEISRSELGDRHPDTALSMNNLAELYRSMGQYERALPLFESALEIRRSELGDRHPSTATTLNNLAGLYRSMGQYERALPLFESALEIWRSELGDRHPNTATSLNNLAGLYRSMGQYERALPLFESALEIRRSELGDRHPDTATSLNNLAELYKSMGQYERALLLYESALEIRRSELGDRHPSTASSLFNLAAIYYNTQKYQKALIFIQEALQIYIPTLGNEHPTTQNANGWLQGIQQAITNQ
jgi:tetratricopeptide (TPR) repeat protein